jgi:hypothetical protein
MRSDSIPSKHVLALQRRAVRAHMARRVPRVAPMVIEPRRRSFGVFIITFLAIVVMVDAQHALDPADDATDRAADNGADRSGAAVAFIKAVRRAARNTLRMCRGGSEDCKNRTDDRNANVHELPLC